MKYIRQKDLKRYRIDHRPAICPITKRADFAPVVDHCHKSGFIRGVICREANAVLGRIENAYCRMSESSRVQSLPQMLRNMADYLEAKPAKHVHPLGFRQLYKRFMYLSKDEQIQAIEDAGGVAYIAHSKKNAEQRQKYYKQLIRGVK